jgi:hypothetical protein
MPTRPCWRRSGQALQGRYEDLKRINDRVDAELLQLKVLWRRQSAAK